MLHRTKVEWPCLSCDFLIRDRCTPQGIANPAGWFKQSASTFNLDPTQIKVDKHQRERHINDNFPMTAYMVAGSQAEKKSDNKIYVMKWSEMEKTTNEDDVDSDEDSDDDVKKVKEPIIRFEQIPHRGSVNRIRTMNNTNIVATWNEDGEVGVYDITQALEELDNPTQKKTA